MFSTFNKKEFQWKCATNFIAKQVVNDNEEPIEHQKEVLQNRNTNTNKEDDIARWSEKLLERYENLRKVVSNNLPHLWPALEFALSVKTILNIRDCTLPFAGIILGPPSSLKTVVIDLFKGSENTFHTHDFSPRAWVSHNAAVKKDKLKDVLIKKSIPLGFN